VNLGGGHQAERSSAPGENEHLGFSFDALILFIKEPVCHEQIAERVLSV
jgi:hypothetical protein